MNKKLQKKVDELTEKVVDQTQSQILEDANDFIVDTLQYYEGLTDLLEYIEDDEDPAAVRQVAADILKEAIDLKAATIRDFDLMVAKLQAMSVKNPK